MLLSVAVVFGYVGEIAEILTAVKAVAYYKVVGDSEQRNVSVKIHLTS